MKKEIEENELREIKKKPDINKESLYIAPQQSKPIHLRTKEILSARKEKQKRLINQIHLEKETRDPEPNYRPNLELTRDQSFSSAKKYRNTSEFLKDIEEWYQKKNEKIQLSQMKCMKDEMKKMPFHPKINKNFRNPV